VSPADAIALPFIERDFETPSYDRKLALDRIRTKEYKARRKKQMKRLTGFAVGDATRRPHYIHGPGVKKDDLLQRLGKCEDAIERICRAMDDNEISAAATISAIKDALSKLNEQIEKERAEHGVDN
jgi:DNA-binding FrmR family transcriptional regulator